ncbi:MAG: hypothetical protein JNM57_14655 [Cyclobacteriaceae bacterium]|nr:hypothetical protein [Cyclobacteriaceae bacterium]
MILPENGSVVIIDDVPEEALPILKVLAKKCVSTTYYQGTSDLPEKPNQSIRLLFLDLQLIETSNEHQIAKSVTGILDRLISKENGPYILVTWSKNYAKYGAVVEEEINKIKHLIPACVVSFNKRDCLEEKVIPLVDKELMLIKVFEMLEGRFEEDDQESIRKSIESALSDEFKTEFIAKPDALQTIEKHISEGLKKAGVFHLFVIWENLIKKSGAHTVQTVANTIDMTDLWEGNMRHVIKRLAAARTGRNKISDDLALRAAMATFTQSFSEEIESAVREFKFPEYVKLNSSFVIARHENGLSYEIVEVEDQGKTKLHVNKNALKIGNLVSPESIATLSETVPADDKVSVKIITDAYVKIPYIINTKLHLELSSTKELVPGNIYKMTTLDAAKKKMYLETYFDKVPDDVTSIDFIELEVSPICDYAQTKWKKSRLISGIIFPEALKLKGKDRDHLYKVHPAFLIDSIPRKLIFDFHLFKSLDNKDVELRNIWFRLKRELLIDITANLSGHVNRPGISFVA